MKCMLTVGLRVEPLTYLSIVATPRVIRHKSWAVCHLNRIELSLECNLRICIQHIHSNMSHSLVLPNNKQATMGLISAGCFCQGLHFLLFCNSDIFEDFQFDF